MGTTKGMPSSSCPALNASGIKRLKVLNHVIPIPNSPYLVESNPIELIQILLLTFACAARERSLRSSFRRRS
jgi:hypothetical protein